MRKSAFIIALLAGAIGVPLAASAQGVVYGPGSTIGSTGRQADIVDRETGQVIGGITLDRRRVFRNYVIEERTPSYTVPGEIRVGTTLPDVGVTYYDVPERFGATSYRYTVVNERTVLVDPVTHRVIQVIE
jgi:Protein of unknown function (DUF1236)